VTHQGIDITFSGVGLTAAPCSVAGLARAYGGDDSALRYQGLSASGVAVMVEEDTTLDAETAHTTEEVAYVAIQGSGTLAGTALDPVVTKVYVFNGQRVAQRTVAGGLDEVAYLHWDHGFADEALAAPA
jgi:hypothetical protein